MELPGDTTIWEVKSIVRALRGTPRRLQTFLVGERLAGATETLASLRADTIALTLVLSEPACAFCGARNQALRCCSGYNNVYYCCALCQTFAWERHQFACAFTHARDYCGVAPPTDCSQLSVGYCGTRPRSALTTSSVRLAKSV